MGKRSEYLNSVFHGKVRKIAVNAGLGCPNRDGGTGTGGCIFCNNAAFSPSYAFGGRKSVTRQIEEGAICLISRPIPTPTAPRRS